MPPSKWGDKLDIIEIYPIDDYWTVINRHCNDKIPSRHKYFLIKGTTCVACHVKASHVLIWEEKPGRGNNGQKIMHVEFIAQNDGERRLLTLDHIEPRSNGGANSYANIQILCNWCNQAKASMPNDLFVEIFTQRYEETGDYDEARNAVETFRANVSRIRNFLGWSRGQYKQDEYNLLMRRPSDAGRD